MASVNIVSLFFCAIEKALLLTGSNSFLGRDNRSIANLISVTLAFFFIILKGKVKASRRLQGERSDPGPRVGCSPWGRKESDPTEVT